MRMRSPMALPAPRREPSYRNALPSRSAGNRLNPLQFESLVGNPRAEAQGTDRSVGAALLLRLLCRFVPSMVQKFPRTGQ